MEKVLHLCKSIIKCIVNFISYCLEPPKLDVKSENPWVSKSALDKKDVFFTSEPKKQLKKPQ